MFVVISYNSNRKLIWSVRKRQNQSGAKMLIIGLSEGLIGENLLTTSFSQALAG